MHELVHEGVTGGYNEAVLEHLHHAAHSEVVGREGLFSTWGSLHNSRPLQETTSPCTGVGELRFVDGDGGVDGVE